MKLFSTILFTAALATSGATAATLSATTGPATSANRAMGASTNIGIGQTWFSTVSATLDSVEVYLTPLFSSAAGPVDISILDYDSLTTLGSVSVDRSSFLSPGSGDQSVLVDFSSFGIGLTNGTQYAVEVLSGADNIFSWARTGTSTYPGIWYDIETAGRTAPSNFQDFALDVYTVAAVPLPAGAVLMLTGLGGLGLMRRRFGTTS